MEANAYNDMISKQVKNINKQYIQDEMRDGRLVKDRNITANSTRGLGRRGGIATGGNWFDDVVGSVAKIAPLAMMALGKPKKGRKGGIVSGGDWDTRTAQMTSENAQHGGIQTGGAWYDFLPLAALALGKPRKGGNTMMEAEQSGSFGSGKKGGIVSGGDSLSDFAFSRYGKGKKGGIQTGGGIMDDPVLNGLDNFLKGKGKSVGGNSFEDFFHSIGHHLLGQGVSKAGVKYLGGVHLIGGPGGVQQMLEAGENMHGAGFWSDFADGFSMPFKFVGNLAEKVLPIAQLVSGKGKRGGAISELEGGIVSGGKRRVGRPCKAGISTGGISTGGISTGGLSRKLLGARAVGGAQVGEGWFDDALGSVVNAVTTLAPVYKDYKKGRGKKGGIVSGGKKTSKWIEHVKRYAREHGMSYKDAMKAAKATY